MRWRGMRPQGPHDHHPKIRLVSAGERFHERRIGLRVSQPKGNVLPQALLMSGIAVPQITCPNAEWRLLFGLARYAGLRIPSESHMLTWGDVDFERARLTVRSPKTEHHEGHEQRIVPITPELMRLLQDRFAEVEEGQQYLVTIAGKGAVIRQVRAVWKRAGVEPWKRLWQTLRSSCEQHWAIDGFPQYVVSHWMGHSIEVSGKHYTNAVPDELFDKAAGQTGAHHISTHECSRTERIERNRLTPTPP